MASPALSIEPPVLNSASPWATTQEDLEVLYDSQYTGAVTTRTSLIRGFKHDPAIHQYLFFPVGNSSVDSATPKGDGSVHELNVSPNIPLSTLNTLGYSPFRLQDYCFWIRRLVDNSPGPAKKPFIVSVTGLSNEMGTAYQLLVDEGKKNAAKSLTLAMEVNLSCPNIAGAPPPAYDSGALREYLAALRRAQSKHGNSVTIGLKLPPYTWSGPFEVVTQALKEYAGTVKFLSCTNTLGGCLVLDTDGRPALHSEAGTGIGGLAGPALHTLALGNVSTFRRLLNVHPETRDIFIIGVGGVEDRAGFLRMKAAGADAVACASAVGRYGVAVFERIARGDD